MRNMQASLWLGLLIGLTATGCGKNLPALTEVEGVVLLDDEPLPHAFVQFMPQLDNFGAEYNSTAVTDDKGHFTLKCYKDDLWGAVIGKHVVLVTDYLPPELRGRDAQEKFAEYYEELKNRPIPENFGSVIKTPLRIEVTGDQKSYKLELTRPK